MKQWLSSSKTKKTPFGLRTRFSRKQYQGWVLRSRKPRSTEALYAANFLKSAKLLKSIEYGKLKRRRALKRPLSRPHHIYVSRFRRRSTTVKVSRSKIYRFAHRFTGKSASLYSGRMLAGSKSQYFRHLRVLNRRVNYMTRMVTKKANSTRLYSKSTITPFSMKFSNDQSLNALRKKLNPALPYILWVNALRASLAGDFPVLLHSLSSLSLRGTDFYSYAHWALAIDNLTRSSVTTVTPLTLTSTQDKVYAKQVRKLLYSSISDNHSNAGQYFNQSALDEPRNLWGAARPLESPLASNVTYMNKLLRQWFLESCFFHRRGLTSPNAVFILAQAPSYRLSLFATSPISTSRHFQNYYKSSTLGICGNTSHNMHSSLFGKAYVNPLSLGFSSSLKPYLRLSRPQLLMKRVFDSTKRSLSDSYRNLHYVKPSVTFSLSTFRRNNRPLSARNHQLIHRLLNLKSIMVFSKRSRGPRKFNRRREKVQKEKFLKRMRYMRLKPRWYTRLKRRQFKKYIRKINSFTRWNIRRFSNFFTRFSRVNKIRRSIIKDLSRSNYASQRTSKAFSALRRQPLHFKTKNMTALNAHHSYKLGTRSGSLKPLPRFDWGLTNASLVWLVLLNPILIKKSLCTATNIITPSVMFPLILKSGLRSFDHQTLNTNLLPHSSFSGALSKRVLNSFANQRFREDIIPLYQNTLIRFIEVCTGRKSMLQFYPFVNQHITKEFIVRYKRWIPRMAFYERSLGHRFFLEESLHILHIGFTLRDPKIIASWLRAIILRISFWKTRSIFRFLKYLFHNYFTYVFDDIKIKGMKIRLKGKISAAGNSRKRTILYRVGQTSHSKVSLRVVKDFSRIKTFTGVMGFQVYLFY